MPVLVNKQTGFAEDLPDEQAHSALYAGTHDVPLVDADGQVGSAPYADAQQMVASGTHMQPTPEQLNKMMAFSRHSSPAEQAKTFAEGLAESSTFGLSTPMQIAAGVSTPQDINERREINPKAHMAGQVTGLIAGMGLPGGGEAGALKALGEGAEAATFGKLAEGAAPGLMERAGRGATRLATEGAAFQSGDELSQHFSDPDRSMGLSAANIGMAALTTPIIGGALGAVADVFKATKAAELQHVLDSAKGYTDAAAAGHDLAPGVGELLANTPELQGAMADNPAAQRAYQSLINSTTGVATDFSGKVAKLKDAVSEGAIGRLGFAPEEIEGANASSNNKIGSQIIKSIDENLSERLKPVNDLYESTGEKYAKAPIYPAMRKNLAEQLAEFSEEQGYSKSPSSTGLKMMTQLDEELPLQKTANDMRKYAENLKAQLPDYEDSFLRRKLTGMIQGAADNAVATRMGEVEGQDAVGLYQNARKGYADIMGDIEDLSDRLKLGRYKGAGGALKNLREMIPEQVLQKVTKTNDAGLIQLLDAKFPEVGQLVKQNQIKDIARDSVLKNGFSLSKFLDKVEELPPETRDSIINPDIYKQLKSDHSLIEKLQMTQNPSGTKKAASGFMRQTVGGLGGYALGALQGPKTAFLMSALGKYFSDVPDAVRLAYLRTIGAGKTPDAMAFRAVVDAAAGVQKSMNSINKGVKSIISGSGSFTVDSLSDPKKKKLEQAAEIYQENPEKFINAPENHLATYEPDHAGAQSAMMARGMQAILAAKPKTRGDGLLDSKITPSKIEMANYNKTLQIVENPLTVLHRVGQGTLTPAELSTFTSVYPGLHKMMVEKITDQLIDMKSKEKSVPYKQRLSLSMFMGTPLDSTMNPAAIAMNQPKPVQNQPQPDSGGGKKGSMKALDKLAGNYSTASQSREQQRAMR